MVTQVHNHYTQPVSGGRVRTNYNWESLDIYSVESAQLQVRQHLSGQIEKIYGHKENPKLQSLIMSRDAQLHINASSLPSLTVKRCNVIFPIIFPTQSKTQQSTPPSIWIESLLWNLINTMELDAPYRGLKAAAARAMLINVASMFHQ